MSVGELLEEIEALTADNRARRDPEVERRILALRHAAGVQLATRPSRRAARPAPAFDLFPSGSGVPEAAGGEVTPELLRAAILRAGCLLVRGAVRRGDAARLAGEIERVFESRELRRSGRPADGHYEEFEPDPRFDVAAERSWIRRPGAGAVWAADSPRVLFETLDALQRAGLERLAAGYLGERPMISVNKCVLRRVPPDIFNGSTGSAWHQDGAFLGDVHALNAWVALSRCGDRAPGLDIVPRRVDLVPTGTDGASFEWSVSRAVAEEAAGETPIARPVFDPGDALLFDELLLHATAADERMAESRYAVECWFFAPSGFPADYVPLCL